MAAYSTTEPTDEFLDNTIRFTVAGSTIVTAGYGGFSTNTTMTIVPADLTAIIISPDATTVTAGTPQGFDRYGNTRGDFTGATAWSSTEPADEFTANSVRFTTAGTSTVTASAGGFTADATLTVVPAPLAVLVIEPAASALTAGDAVAFTTSGFDSFGNSRGDVTDLSTFSSSQPADEIRENVVGFTTSGTSRITARIGEIEAQATLVVTPGPLASVTVTPGSDTTDVGIAQTFSSEGFDTFGNSRGDLTADAILTSLDDTDVITANSILFVVSGRNTVTATVDGIAGTFPLTVIAGEAIRITLNANATTVRQGDSLTFFVTGVDQYGNNLGDLSGLITLTNNWSEDIISGATVTFPHASPHIITATLNGVSISVNIEVIPTPLASAILAITGADSALPLTGALLTLLLGVTAVIARARRRQEA
ncbi:hypothetical protein [Cryobacterium glaciale]|uniref:hypothetical protein n=1 Tax=Cryobacterium glaciale TaxID=1259145 RepID=UPI001F53FFA2|nr:hypothetical protein [Cryobacterium glaciale]